MNVHTDDQHLEALLRRTMREDAAAVHDTPMPTLAATRRANGHRAAWIGGSLAAAAVVALSVTASAYFGSGDRSSGPATGHVRTTCNARPLTPSFDAQLRAASTPLRYEGKPAFAIATLPNGSVVAGKFNADKSDDVVLDPREGEARHLMSLPARQYAPYVDADNNHVVINSGRGRIDNITLIDLQSGTTTELLDALPANERRTVSGHGAMIQNGVVYWIDAPTPTGPSGNVLAYDIASEHVVTVGYAATGELDRDSRGIGWVGGSVPNAAAPPGVLPDFFDNGDHYQPVFTDGHSTVWQEADDLGAEGRRPGPLHIRTDDGIETTWSPTYRGYQGDLDVDGVSGHFVFLSGSHDEYLLDVRTGAIADMGDVRPSYPSLDLRGGLTTMATSKNSGSLRIDVAELPELTC